MENLSRETIDECMAFVMPQLREYEERTGYEPRSEIAVRFAVAIAMKHRLKGLRRRAWQRAVESEFSGTQPEVGSVLLVVSIILSLVRIYLELRDRSEGGGS